MRRLCSPVMGTLVLALPAFGCSGGALPSKAPEAPPAAVEIPQAPRAVDTPLPKPAVATPELIGTEWKLECFNFDCNIDYFALNQGGQATYHYHNGSVHEDGLWRVEDGTLVITLNTGYSTYRAPRLGAGFADGRFVNTTGLAFGFRLTQRSRR